MGQISVSLALSTATWSAFGPDGTRRAQGMLDGWRTLLRAARNFVVPQPQIALGASTAEEVAGDSARAKSFLLACEAAADLADQMAEEGEGDPADWDTWISALRFLAPNARYLPTPLIMPLQRGGLGFEWHTHGINLELRFRPGSPLYTLVEDARRELPASRGRENGEFRANEALRALIGRTR